MGRSCALASLTLAQLVFWGSLGCSIPKDHRDTRHARPPVPKGPDAPPPAEPVAEADRTPATDPRAGALQKADARAVVDAVGEYFAATYDLRWAMKNQGSVDSLRVVQETARQSLVSVLAGEGLDPDIDRLAGTLRGLLAGHAEYVILGPGPVARYIEAATKEPLAGFRIARVGNWRRGLIAQTPLGEQVYEAADIEAMAVDDEISHWVKRGHWPASLPFVPVEVHGVSIFRHRPEVEAVAEALFFDREAQLRAAADQLSSLIKNNEGSAAEWLSLAKDALRFRQYGDLFDVCRNMNPQSKSRRFATTFLAAEEERAAIRLAFVREGTADMVGAEGAALLAAMAYGQPLDALATTLALRAQVLAAPQGAIIPPVGEAAAGALAILAEKLGDPPLSVLVALREDDIRQAALKALGAP